MQPQRHTYAEFLHADEDSPGQVCYSAQEVPPGMRDPLVPILGGVPTDALGVRFYDLLTVEVTDPHTGKSVECRSERLDQSPGISFYSGMVYPRVEVMAGKAATIDKADYTAVVNAMQANGWAAIIHIAGMILPFDPRHDKELG
jgi:hypothetical protein